ncbi:MAG: CYTH domain-containing protein [Lachnospiraceae bacterium]|nr:CYTH domain-containing protein [Lachnospiraceae bacterium]
MEIERKFLIKTLPSNLNTYEKKHLEQAYLCTAPVIRVREEGEEYILTYKGKGLMVREEYNLPLTQDAYLHLRAKADGNIISKTRYFIPEKDGLTIELDVFEGVHAPLIMAEVEFPNEKAATNYIAPEWFGEEVTNNPSYHNSNMT